MAVTMIYNSPQFCVFEFEGAALVGDRDVGGYENHGQAPAQGISWAVTTPPRFARACRNSLSKSRLPNKSMKLLQGFRGLMHQPVILH